MQELELGLENDRLRRPLTRTAHDGEVVAEILANVLKNEPDWSVLPAELPGTIHEALQLCLTKDRKRRMRDIGDLRLVMEGAFGKSAGQKRKSSLGQQVGDWGAPSPQRSF